MWDAHPGGELMEDSASGNPDKLPSIFGWVLDRIVWSFVTSEVVIPFLHRYGFLGLIIVGDDSLRTFAYWNRDFAFFV